MVEKEYIEREALIDRVEEIDWYHIGSQGNLAIGAGSDTDMPLYKADDIYEALETCPAADVVEVVRCKDCEHTCFIKCERWCTFLDVRMSDNDFCSYGVAKEDRKGESE